MSHVIITSQSGTGPGGSAESQVKYTPSHDLSGNEQIHRIKKATKALERINDFLYNNGPDPAPGD